jgi:hypothetical protein
MFSWIEKLDGTNDHPMADVAAARTVLADLPGDDPLKALEEITSWLVSVKETAGFRPERRTSVVMLLDETAQPFHTMLLREYLAAPHLQDFHGMYIWKGIHAQMKAQAEAYGLCAQECRQPDKFPLEFKEIIPVIYVRLIRSIAEQLKLELMRYIEVEQTVWSQLYAAYQLAEANQMEGAMVYAYAGNPIHTNPQRELLRALVLYVSSPDTLAPDQIEVAYRIAGRMVSFFDMQEHPSAECPNFIDLAAPAAPGQVDANLQAVPAMRFFGTLRAVPKVEDITRQNESGMLQQEKRFGNEFSPDGKLTVLKHLHRYWSSMKPHRHGERTQINVTVEVIHGYKTIGNLVAHIEPGEMQNLSDKDTAMLKEHASINIADEKIDYTTETWTVLDASSGGLGGIMPMTAGSWGKIGALCGLKTKQDNPWWVGTIRRIHTDTQDKVHVGIEIIARKPLAVWLRILGKSAEKVSNWETSSGSFEYDYLHVILLPDSHNSYLNATILMESGSYVAGQIYEMMMGEKSRAIKFTGLLAEGEDYEQVSFQWTDSAPG